MQKSYTSFVTKVTRALLDLFNAIVKNMAFKFLFAKILLLIYKNKIGDLAEFTS